MHPKQKGTLAETKVTADLYSKGFGVSVPVCDLLPFDLVVNDDSLQLYKVQVKYCEIKKGVATLYLKRCMSNKTLSYEKVYTQREVDVFALYVKDLDVCLYISADILETHKTMFKIRVDESRGLGGPKTNHMKDFLEFPF